MLLVRQKLEKQCSHHGNRQYRTIASLSEETLIYLLLSRLLLEATFYWNAEEKKQHRDTFVYTTKTAGCIPATKCQKHPSRKKLSIFVAVNSKTRERFSLIWANSNLCFQTNPPQQKQKNWWNKEFFLIFLPQTEKKTFEDSSTVQLPLKQHLILNSRVCVTKSLSDLMSTLDYLFWRQRQL